MQQKEFKAKLRDETLEPLDKQIMEKANFDYICVHNGKQHLRLCIRDAVEKVTNLSEQQFCTLFGIYQNDMEMYIDKLYKKMQDMGAE